MGAPTAHTDWRDLPLERKVMLRDRLRERRVGQWEDQARPAQVVGDAYLTFITGGRRSGKTRAGAEWLARKLADDGRGDVSAIVAPTFGEGRDKCVEGVSGVLGALERRGVGVRSWNRSLGELWLDSGAKVIVDEAFTGAQKVQGEGLRRAWCDELRNWRSPRWDEMAWDESLLPAVSAGDPQIVVTSTLKPKRLVKRLLSDPRVDRRHMTIWENAENLSEEFLTQMRERYEGTRLGLQELEGRLIEDVEGALWKRDWIDGPRRAEPVAPLRAHVLGLDPADGLEEGDEQGSALVAVDLNGDLYVVDSWGHRDTPAVWLEWAVRKAREYSAVIVVEKNHGAAYLVGLLETVMRDIGIRAPYKTVTASVGKRTRAEPVALLYEQRKVVHLGVFPELEEQLTNFDGSGPSPDRADALVWAISEAMGYGSVGTVDGEGAVPYEATPDGLQPGSGAVAWR